LKKFFRSNFPALSSAPYQLVGIVVTNLAAKCVRFVVAGKSYTEMT